ncbi:biotin/lipoyl-containing protein, partial [Nostocoides japonicum]|uniref:biotin/lipoyl-containing protein n=1 Tax=Nostocoides japonicum TaxID=99481 RepID=UPI00065BB462
MSIKEFRLPDPGEGLTEADIVSWKVRPGDTVKVNDIVVEIETAKSLVELPVPFAGTVTSLLVEEGATVEVGTPIIAVDDGLGGADEPPGAAPGATDVEDAPAEGAVEPGLVGSPAPKAEEAIEEGKIGGTTSTGRTAVLVGYGVKQTEAKRRPRKGAPAPSGPAPADTSPSAVRALAKPPVRKLAKDLGVDLASVPGTGEGGIVTRTDVESYA